MYIQQTAENCGGTSDPGVGYAVSRREAGDELLSVPK